MTPKAPRRRVVAVAAEEGAEEEGGLEVEDRALLIGPTLADGAGRWIASSAVAHDITNAFRNIFWVAEGRA